MPVFEFNGRLNQIHIVGCGGTGAQIARIVARIIYDLRARRKHIPDLVISDPDTVAKKNIGRQLFTEADLGQNKAVVVAKRLNYALGLHVAALPESFKPIDHWGEALYIGAVDSHQGRKAIAKHIDQSTNDLWLDCGNHDNAAQLVLGNIDLDTWQKRARAGRTSDEKWVKLPHVGALFPDMLKAKRARRKTNVATLPAPAEGNCADDIASGKQHLLINDLVAAAAGQYIYKLLNNQPVESFMTWIDGESLSMRSLPICAEEIQQFIPTSVKQQG